jgi:hypothetical protein
MSTKDDDYTSNLDPSEVPHDIGNYLKADRTIFERAATMTSSDVVWDEEATYHMPAPLRDDYGSLWTSSRDLSDFWRCVEQLRRARAPGGTP